MLYKQPAEIQYLLEDASLHHCLYAPMFLFTSRPTHPFCCAYYILIYDAHSFPYLLLKKNKCHHVLVCSKGWGKGSQHSGHELSIRANI